MQETSVYHLLIEHPVVVFLVVALAIVALAFVIAGKVSSYWENRRDGDKKELRKNGKTGTN
jgi:hypothetical protein